MTEACEHKFKVDRVFDSRPIIQFLSCKKCDEQFFGYDGEVGNPVVIHPMRKPMHEQMFKNMLYQNIDLKVKND